MLAVAVVAPPSSSSSAALSARASATSRGDVVVVAATRRATATATLPRRVGVVRRTVPRRALVVVANVRPYTVRKGDTLASIASKRGMSVEEVKRNNKGRSPSADAEVKPGETILLPAGKLSKRDSEIIAGITKINQPREYPTRKGETIGEIIGQRGISFEDVQRLNPGVNLGTFNAGERLKLPPGKYTTREKEMLQGCGILPAETVNPLMSMMIRQNAKYAVGAAVFITIYAMYCRACYRYQKYGIRLWGNDKPENLQD